MVPSHLAAGGKGKNVCFVFCPRQKLPVAMSNSMDRISRTHTQTRTHIHTLREMLPEAHRLPGCPEGFAVDRKQNNTSCLKPSPCELLSATKRREQQTWDNRIPLIPEGRLGTRELRNLAHETRLCLQTIYVLRRSADSGPRQHPPRSGWPCWRPACWLVQKDIFHGIGRKSRILHSMF